MKIHLEKAIFVNRAPFDKLVLDFSENEIAVLSAVNGRGKTTILSHIVDVFYEMARPHFPNEFEDNKNKLYRISSRIYNLDQTQPSFVYLRFKTIEGTIDYIDIRNNCTEQQYNGAITIENKIPFDKIKSKLEESDYVKHISSNFDKKNAEKTFSNNILTYFPSYRFEMPGYLNEPYKVKLDFKIQSDFSGYLNNPIEVVSGLSQLANWIMDIVIDLQYSNVQIVKQNLDEIVTQTVISKKIGSLRLGIGPRGYGASRIQIGQDTTANQQSTWEMIYPSIFNLSSGESAILCLFGELLRQADNNKNNITLNEITGIVLIDEIDKHLHIKLQKEILPNLFNFFPNIQFIVSSHSPFLSMGLAEVVQERSKIIDLDNLGISKDPTTNELYTEVYNMMISENERFKEMYQSISSKIENTKHLQIVTEGNNTEHIEKAIQILDSSLMCEVQIIKGAEDQSGDQQLKNAFDIMSKGNHASKFLFVWDCDSINVFNRVVETSHFKKFCFKKNDNNTKVEIGIENLYSENFFTEDVYDTKKTKNKYGGSKTEDILNKRKFLTKIKQKTEFSVFKKYQPLINKIKDIVNPNEDVTQVTKQ
ncbi:MAG: putative ATP-binding protein involved in virulence [Candidatus Methanomarinus sp.]|nr:MAG: putative ATP-binding protein involved in virulence [ANME-2 cluster archaeon]